MMTGDHVQVYLGEQLPDDTELMGAGAAGRLAAEAGMGMPLLFRPSTRLEGRELQKMRRDLLFS